MEEDPVLGILDRHCPQKSWGWEEWIVNNDMYCGKRLHFNVEGGHTSLHFHMKKHETMYVESGVFEITIINPNDADRTKYVLHEGESIVIKPGTVHRITAVTKGQSGIEAVLVEFSTHHEDADSYRVEL